MRQEASEYGIPIIQIRTYNTSNLCPSLFRTLSRDDTPLTLLNLSFPFREMFRSRIYNTALATLKITRVCYCVCVAKPIAYIFWKLLCSVLKKFSCHKSLFSDKQTSPTNLYILAPEGKTKNIVCLTALK